MTGEILKAFILIFIAEMGDKTQILAKAELLHAYYEHIREDLDHMCMGTEYCQSCHGQACIIGHAKSHVNAVIIDKQVSFADEEVSSNYISKPFSRENAIDSLVDTLWLIEHIQENSELQTAHMMRRKMECILFGTSIDEYLGYNTIAWKAVFKR